MTLFRWLNGLLLCVMATVVVAEPEPADLLAQLFTSASERKQIDLERSHALSGETLLEEIPLQDPDIFYRAVLFRQGLEPLLWINDRKNTLAGWQSHTDRLVVQQLWLKGDQLSVVLDGKTWQLRPNQVLNRQTQEVTEAYDYQPVLLQPVSGVLGGSSGVTPQGTTTQSATSATAGKKGSAFELMKKAVELRERQSQLLAR